VKEGDTSAQYPSFPESHFPPTPSPHKKPSLIFDRKKFIQLITNKPALTMNILALMARRLRDFTIQVEICRLKKYPSSGRLSIYLSQEQGNKDSVKLNISKVQLATFLARAGITFPRIGKHEKQKTYRGRW